MNNRNVILTLFTIFVLFPFFIISTIAIADPDYVETIPPGQAFVIGGNLNEGEIVRIEYKVISGGNKDVDFYIKNSNEVIVIDIGRVIGYGLYHFNVPYDDYFKIVFSNTFSIITSKVIEIKIDIVKSLTITSPTTIDTFLSGYNYITWTSTGDISYVQIELYKVGMFLETISFYEYNDGSYMWSIYDDEYEDGSYYQIKIIDYYDDSIYDYTNYFAIETETKTITITSPTSVSTFVSGDSLITWTSTGDISYVKIDLYKENAYLETISSYTGNDGSYIWKKENDEYIDGPYYQIKISDSYDNTIYDYSDYFTMATEAHGYSRVPSIYPIWNILLYIIIPVAVILTIAVVLIHKRRRQIPKEKRITEDEIEKEGITTVEKLSKIQEGKVSGKFYCSLCGAEILDIVFGYCSKCGAPINK